MISGLLAGSFGRRRWWVAVSSTCLGLHRTNRLTEPAIIPRRSSSENSSTQIYENKTNLPSFISSLRITGDHLLCKIHVDRRTRQSIPPIHVAHALKLILNQASMLCPIPGCDPYLIWLDKRIVATSTFVLKTNLGSEVDIAAETEPKVVAITQSFRSEVRRYKTRGNSFLSKRTFSIHVFTHTTVPKQSDVVYTEFQRAIKDA